MRFPSDELYESKLVAADGVKARLLKDLPYEVDETEDTIEPFIFFDTQGGDFPEKSEEEDVDKKAGKGMIGESKSNEMEAALVKQHVQNLVDAGVKPEDIAVVTPYNAQVRWFLHLCSSRLETRIVEDFTCIDTEIACLDVPFNERSISGHRTWKCRWIPRKREGSNYREPRQK